MATNGTSPSAVGLVTGGASGMGLSVVKRLVELKWNVTIVDLNESAGLKVAGELGQQVLFVQADITNYDQIAQAFVQTWERWHRLDFVFANAGIGDRIDFYAPAVEREDGSPPKPDTAVVDVCLYGVVYAAYLALHYFRKNTTKGGKFVSTSSMCGLYPGDRIPLYTAAKHGVVGLTRALAQRISQLDEPITMNCICPGLVDTSLTPALMAIAPDEIVTPHATIIKAVESFINDDSKNGLAAECSTTNIHYRVQPEWGDEMAEMLMTGKFRRVNRETE